ncbi:MAG: hypothetical protein ACLQRM_04770 [Acidimicrobiales bacterium]
MTVSAIDPSPPSQPGGNDERVVLFDPARLPAAFDAGANALRVVILVSPTCPICLDGVALVREGLAELEFGEVAIHVVWLPVLKGDTPEAAEKSARALGTAAQAFHYWDVDLALSKRYCELLKLEQRGRAVAWDLYLIYGRGSRWTANPPVPKLWMQQLLLEDVPELERSLFVGQLRQMLEPTDV